MMYNGYMTNERFWTKVRKTDTCWIWTGAKANNYGQFMYEGKVMGAHRASYEINVAPVGDAWVLHKCDTPLCVNPDHLFLGTPKENTHDMLNKDRRPRKLTDEQVREIRALRGHMRGVSIAKRYGVHSTTVSEIHLGKIYKGVI